MNLWRLDKGEVSSGLGYQFHHLISGTAT